MGFTNIMGIYNPAERTLVCECCLKDTIVIRTWFLRDYYGLDGRFCRKCFEKVKHDSNGKPEHPKQYRKIIDIFEARKNMKEL